MEMEPIITAGAAVAFSVAGFFMSHKKSKPRGNLRSTRSESDLKKMGESSMEADTELRKGTQAQAAMASAAAASDNSKGSLIPSNGPRGFRRGLRIISTDEGHCNIIQRTSIAPPPFLPTLLEEAEENEEGKGQQNNQESEPETKIETENNNNLENEEEIKSHKSLNGEEEEEGTTSNKPYSLFQTNSGQSEAETGTKIEQKRSNISEKEAEVKYPHMLAHKLRKIEENLSSKHGSLFPTKTGQHQNEPDTKIIEQEKRTVKEKIQEIDRSQVLVRQLLEEEEEEEEEDEEEEEEELEKEEDIKCLHVLPQTLLEKKEETISFSPENTEQPNSNPEPKNEQEKKDDVEKEKEIERLSALAATLLARERDLEMQMLEYYGLKEQEQAMKEMENMLKNNSTEAKNLSLKVESLEEENERLKKQVLELEKATNKNERNKEKIKMLKKRLMSEDDEAKEKIALLRERIETLADKKEKSAAEYEEMESKLERVKELEEEVNKLKTLNARLEEENSGLAHQLENVQLVASSTMRGPEEQVLEEATRLRELNEKLEQEIDQLRTNHYLSIEEVHQLKCLNERLLYELKNYKPSKGKIVGSEITNSPGHHSREKVKRLFNEYSNLGINLTEADLVDHDYDYISSQGPSTLTSPKGQHTGKHSKNKPHKIFGKIKKIVTGKMNSHAEKDKMSLLTSDNASTSCSDESSLSSSMMTVERFPRSENHLRSARNMPGQKKLEPEYARSNSDLLGLPNAPRGEPRRYHALHLDHPSTDVDHREVEQIEKRANALSSSRLSSRH